MLIGQIQYNVKLQGNFSLLQMWSHLLRLYGVLKRPENGWVVSQRCQMWNMQNASNIHNASISLQMFSKSCVLGLIKVKAGWWGRSCALQVGQECHTSSEVLPVPAARITLGLLTPSQRSAIFK